MKIEEYKKAKELLESKEILRKLQDIFYYPYPRIFSPLKKLSFFHKSPLIEVCFISLDEETQKELKDAIKSIIEKRLREIEDELENL